MCILILSRFDIFVIIWEVTCLVAEVFKVYFCNIWNCYVIIISRCYNKNIVYICLLNWFLLRYLCCDKCVHKFWLYIQNPCQAYVWIVKLEQRVRGQSQITIKPWRTKKPICLSPNPGKSYKDQGSIQNVRNLWNSQFVKEITC